ncbi:NRT1/ PTR family protein 4.3 [Tanacetum coccineum]
MLTDGDRCIEAMEVEALIFFLPLYLVALGNGCKKHNMLAHGADQFNKSLKKYMRVVQLINGKFETERGHGGDRGGCVSGWILPGRICIGDDGFKNGRCEGKNARV